MSTVLAIVTVALLFAVFGALRPAEKGNACGACSHADGCSREAGCTLESAGLER